MKKFKLTEETKTITHPISKQEVILHRIESLINFTLINGIQINIGYKGGWVEKEENLSHDDLCWIYGECMMFDNAHRFENSIGFGSSMQFGYSRQYGSSQQFDNSRQYEKSKQCGKSQQFEYSQQCGHSQQSGESKQYGKSKQCGKSQQCGESRQFGESKQFDDSQQYEKSQQCGKSKQLGYSRQCGDFVHSNGSHISSSNRGILTEKNELIEFNNIGEINRSINYDKTTKIININNCFIGNVVELEKAVIEKYGKDSNTNYFDVIKMIKSFEQ